MNLCGVTLMLPMVCPVDGPVILCCSLYSFALFIGCYTVSGLDFNMFSFPLKHIKHIACVHSYHKHAEAPPRIL